MNKESKIKLLIALKQGKITREKAKELLQLPDIPLFIKPDTNEKQLIFLLNELEIDFIKVEIVY